MRKTIIGSIFNATQNRNRPLLGVAIKVILYYPYCKTPVVQLEFLGANIANPLTLYHVPPPLLENYNLFVANR
jgi:hypothetical protein